MWEYNYNYLAHGLRGYKYIERKRGKNGKWQYIYPDSAEGKRIDAGRRAEEGINRPLTNPNRALLYGRTPGASVPKIKPSITRNGKASDNTVTTTSPKTSASSKEAIKNLGAEITGKLKDAYDKTLGSEDFKKYRDQKNFEAAVKEIDDENKKILDNLSGIDLDSINKIRSDENFSRYVDTYVDERRRGIYDDDMLRKQLKRLITRYELGYDPTGRDKVR